MKAGRPASAPNSVACADGPIVSRLLTFWSHLVRASHTGTRVCFGEQHELLTSAANLNTCTQEQCQRSAEVFERLDIADSPKACMICACLEKERPRCSWCYSGCGDAFVPHVRKVEHACQDRNHLPWQLPPEYAATVSRRPEICLHKWVEPLDFQRSKPRHDCTRQRYPSFGDRSRTQVLPKPMAVTCASASLRLSKTSPRSLNMNE